MYFFRRWLRVWTTRNAYNWRNGLVENGSVSRFSTRSAETDATQRFSIRYVTTRAQLWPYFTRPRDRCMGHTRLLAGKVEMYRKMIPTISFFNFSLRVKIDTKGIKPLHMDPGIILTAVQVSMDFQRSLINVKCITEFSNWMETWTVSMLLTTTQEVSQPASWTTAAWMSWIWRCTKCQVCVLFVIRSF